ncbi:alpha/beta-hydrolase [Saccharata proteae CBS 121410]|uniref:Alpha/beta-hydrolase n=1 Tax=Saccharata proteae CBS 121410 TaxID=1314787 RepID=A0A9P4HTH2_9PEZI|nr:alpha/beta-hydrolase [Saccharata proteae CBS 121410]
MSAFATEEGWHTTDDGLKLFTKTWKPTGETKARLVFIHGFSDHCNAYGTLFPGLASQGIAVFSYDQRGWGRSVHKPAQKGLTGPTSTVLNDITSFIRPLLPPADYSTTPLFLMGHSMGGAEVLHYAATGPDDVRKHIRGYLAESPFVALSEASRPWRITVILGRLAAKVLPNKHLFNALNYKLLSRDITVGEGFRDDELCHDTGTLEGLAGMLDRAEQLETGAVQLKEGAGEGGQTRVWVGHGTGDGICEFGPAKKAFHMWHVKDKTFKEYDGWYHKLHAEPGTDKDTFLSDVTSWILARCEGEAENPQSQARSSKL